MGENGFCGRATAALHKIYTYTMNYVKLNAASVTHGFVQKSGVWQGSSPSCLLATIVYEGLFQEMCQMHMAGSREANAPKPQSDPGAAATKIPESVWHPKEAVEIGDGTPVHAMA